MREINTLGKLQQDGELRPDKSPGRHHHACMQVWQAGEASKFMIVAG
jgi:hypothetical protein